MPAWCCWRDNVASVVYKTLNNKVSETSLKPYSCQLCHYGQAINNSHASQRNGFRSSAWISRIVGLQVRRHKPYELPRGVPCCRPIISSIQNPSPSPNSKKHCRWSGAACHRNCSTRLLQASHTTEEMHRSWRWTFRALRVINCALYC